MRLLKKNVLLRPMTKRIQSAGGILLPQDYQDDRKQWVVDAVSPNVINVTPGDRVLLDAYATPNNVLLEDGRVIVDAERILMKW